MAEAVDLRAGPGDAAGGSDGRSSAGVRDRLSSLRKAVTRPRWSPDRVLAFVGALLIAGGVVSIGLAWYGAAHTPFLFEQIPYLISGGLLGIGLLAAGGTLYVGSWVVRMALDQRRHAERLEELLVGLRDDLQRLPTAATDPGVTQEIPVASGALLATPTGTMYHLPDCPVVADRDDARPVGPDDRAEMSPCKICEPA